MQKNQELITYTLDPDNLPPISPEQQEQLDALSAMPDSEIDYSDIPPFSEFKGFFRPGRDTATLRLDHDVLEWLRSMKGEFQQRVNEILRREMLATQSHAEA